MSEELENSLQQAIETYVNDRLRSIDEQLSRLQSEMSEGLARLREQSATQSLDGTPVSAAIFAHLQTARGEHLGAPAATEPPAGAANLKRATQEIEAQQSQTDVLKALLRGAVDFAERAALFVIKNEQAIGWRVARANDPDLEMIGGVSLPLTAETVVTRAARQRAVASGTDGSDSDYAMLQDQLGGSPGTVVALPLVVRGKVVAVLYGDSASTDANTLNSDALEVLTRVASMAVHIVSIQRAMPHPHAASAEAKPPAAQPEPPAVAATYVPHVEVMAPPAGRPVEQFTAPEPVAEPPASQFTHEVEFEAPKPIEAAEVTYHEPVPAFVAEPVEATPAYEPEMSAQFEPPPEPAPVEAPRSAEPAPAFGAPYSAPLGTTRRAVTEPELPIDVSEDERRLHNDARRFARLLVSEIKLYNEPKVQEGRNKGDLYDRLRDDIDRSRQMYDKRVAPPVAARHDYFHQELVNTLAEGDPAKLGMSYPGAAVSAN